MCLITNNYICGERFFRPDRIAHLVQRPSLKGKRENRTVCGGVFCFCSFAGLPRDSGGWLLKKEPKSGNYGRTRGRLEQVNHETAWVRSLVFHFYFLSVSQSNLSDDLSLSCFFDVS